MVYRTRTVNDRFMLDPRRDLGRETFSLLLFSRSPLRERGDATRADLVKSSWIPDGGGLRPKAGNEAASFLCFFEKFSSKF